MKIRPVGVELLQTEEPTTDRQANRHDEDKSHFSKFCERSQNSITYVLIEVFKQTHVLWDTTPCNALQNVKQFPKLQGTWLLPPTDSGFGTPSAE